MVGHISHGTDIYVDGTGKFEDQIVSLIPDGGLSPFSVLSTVWNENANVDYLDDHHGAWYQSRTNHTGFQLASTISDFSAATRAVTLLGLSVVAGSPITAADTILSAFGKLQGQVNTNTSSVVGTAGYLPLFVTSTTLGNSVASQSGSVITITGQTRNVSGTNKNTLLGYDNSTQASFFSGADSVGGTIGMSRASDGSYTSSIFTYASTSAPGNALMGYYSRYGHSFGSNSAEHIRITENGQLQSLKATGSSPFLIASTTLNINLNADLLDGQHGAYYLARVNHTGTQLASTISDFSSATLSVTLAGLSIVTGSTITSVDTILSAFGKLQGQVNTSIANVTGVVGNLPKFGTTTSLTQSIVNETTGLITVSGKFISNAGSNKNIQLGYDNTAHAAFFTGANNVGGVIGMSRASDATYVNSIFSYTSTASPGNALIGYYSRYGHSFGSNSAEHVRITENGQIQSLKTTGSSPFIIASTTLNTNLNADLLDDQHGTYYLDWNNFTNYKTLTAGVGMTGGGTLAADRTLTLGTPSTLSSSSTNSVTGTTHTHAITTGNLVQGTNVVLSGTLTNRLVDSGNVTISVTNAPWSIVTGRPIDLSGYGILDAYTKTYIDATFSVIGHTHQNLTPGTGLTGSVYNTGSAQTWSVTYGTGSGTAAQGNDSRINNGQTAYSSLGNYLLLTGGTLTGDLYINDSKFRSISTGLVISKNGGTPNILIRPNGDTDSTNQTLFSASGASITVTGGNSDRWNQAFDWGDHSVAGYALAGRTLTINGVTYDLSANRSWTISTGGGGTVTGTGASGLFALWSGSTSLTMADMRQVSSDLIQITSAAFCVGAGTRADRLALSASSGWEGALFYQMDTVGTSNSGLKIFNGTSWRNVDTSAVP